MRRVRRVPYPVAMGGRLVEAITGLAVLASAAILVVMLAAPLLVPAAAVPSPEASPSPSDRSEVPPLGQFILNGPLNFGDLCLGMVLEPRAYPVAAGARGAATVLWWQSSIGDSGNPAACQSRAGDLHAEEAVVERIPDDDDPDGAPIGYTLLFHLPGPTGGERDMEIALLTAQSTPDRIQALDMSTSGSGLLFLRTDEIDPPFEPGPSTTATAVVPPNGFFLLRGSLDADGPCLVLELGAPSYPVAPNAEGVARVRSWEPAVRDNEDPAHCLTRRGEIHETEASVVASDDRLAFEARFSVPGADGETAELVVITFDAAQPSPDQLSAVLVQPNAGRSLVFDRVDAIDPPLVPAPSP